MYPKLRVYTRTNARNADYSPNLTNNAATSARTPRTAGQCQCQWATMSSPCPLSRFYYWYPIDYSPSPLYCYLFRRSVSRVMCSAHCTAQPREISRLTPISFHCTYCTKTVNAWATVFLPMCPYIIRVHCCLRDVSPSMWCHDIDSSIMDFIMYTNKPKKMHCNALLFVCVFITLQYSIHTVSNQCMIWLGIRVRFAANMTILLLKIHMKLYCYYGAELWWFP